MSAAFVPTFTRHLTLHGKADAWRLGNNVLNALLLVDRRARRRSGIVFARPLVALYAGDLRERAGQARADDPADARHAAVSDARRGRRGGDGHAELAASLLRPGARRRRCSTSRRSSCAFVLVPVMPSLGLPRDHGDRDRGAARRTRPGRDAVAGAAARGIPLSRRARSARPGLRRVLMLMGPGHDRPGGDAGQPLRQHAARDQPGHRRRLVADLRVPADVPADRPVRRLDRDGGAAGGLAARGGRRPRRRSATTVSRGLALMLMLNVPATLGPDRAGHADRASCCSSTAGSCRRTRRRRRRRCGSTRSASSATRRRGSRRRPSTRSARAACRSPSASARSPSTSSLSVVAGRARWASAAWRSARRSRRSRTAALLVLLLRRRLGGIDGRRLAIAFVEDRWRRRP